MNVYETENNNKRTNANIMNVGDTVTGIISTHADVDCYRLTIPRNAWVTYELDIPTGTDYRIRVFTNDNSLAEAEDIRLGDLGQMRSCTSYIHDTTNTYYICISANTSNLCNPNANYTLRVFYSNNELVTDALEGLRSSLNQKYWNAGLTASQLSASNLGVTNTPCPSNGCTSNNYYSAWQCCGFALFLAYLVFGDVITHGTAALASNNTIIHASSGDWTVHKGSTANYNITLKPGDIIRKDNHSFMILNYNNESDVSVVECWGSVGCKISYGYYYGSPIPSTAAQLLSGEIEYILVSPIKKTC